MTKQERDDLRNAIADYMWSEGCGCCRNHEKHEENRKRLAALLQIVPDTGGDFSFFQYRTTVGKGEGQ